MSSSPSAVPRSPVPTLPSPAGTVVQPAVAPPAEVPADVERARRDRARAEARAEARETEWMVAFRDGREAAAFEALYRSSRGAILGWIQHLLAVRRQNGDPLELLQDTFVNVYRYAGGFRTSAGEGFRGWARTIAANVVRRAQRRRALQFSSLGEGGFDPADSRSDPERHVESREQAIEMGRAWTLVLLHYAQAYTLLSARDQRALHLVEVEGCSYEESARTLEVGASNMKMIIFRARKRLRAHILRAMNGGSAQGGAAATSRRAG